MTKECSRLVAELFKTYGYTFDTVNDCLTRKEEWHCRMAIRFLDDFLGRLTDAEREGCISNIEEFRAEIAKLYEDVSRTYRMIVK